MSKARGKEDGSNHVQMLLSIRTSYSDSATPRRFKARKLTWIKCNDGLGARENMKTVSTAARATETIRTTTPHEELRHHFWAQERRGVDECGRVDYQPSRRLSPEWSGPGIRGPLLNKVLG